MQFGRLLGLGVLTVTLVILATDRGVATSGATLGGLWRMRGFPAQRFSDKAAIYYALEYRMIPEWNPFNNWPWLQKYIGIEWMQFAPFVEVGRVAPTGISMICTRT